MDRLGDIDTMFVTVDSIFNTTINGVDLKSMYVSYHKQAQNSFGHDNYRSIIIEKIGDIAYMFNWFNEKQLACDMNYTSGLRCYQDTNLGLYNRSPYTCDYTYYWTSIKNEENIFEQISILPNPSRNCFILNLNNLKNVSIQVFDINGRLVYSRLKASNVVKLDLDVQQGIYFLQLSHSNKTYKQKLIVQN